ncbi:glycosyltransferase family 1 protein [Pedobacter nutrimenti]|uniref:glycosyltransferase family 4 protein n=1 Tax=Pedobacter nutrimenti TaxID=1241337 RepID=UPI0029303CAE|nr:glycosyltransferase family 1 protein [Pedobacter nutrimenti]
MLNILYDHQIFTMQHYGGISRYFASIQSGLEKQPDIHFNNGVLYSKNYYIKDNTYLPSYLSKVFLKKDRSIQKWNRKYSEYLIKKDNYDVFHPTYYNPYFLKSIKKPFVITVHDMIHELFPEMFEPGDVFVNYKRRCIENAAHIIAISQSTKNDIINILGVDENRISVVHHGFRPQMSVTSDLTDSEKKQDYLLFVGDRKGYKNFPRLATALTPFLKRNPEIKLVCAGGGAFQSAELELFIRLGISDRVQQISASDETLSRLYKNAMAFLFPSLYEGFGLPILEAFQNDCPIIASQTDCFKEIGEDAIQYFNPYEESSILNALEEVVENKQKALTLVNRGRQQLQKFPMESCIDKTLNIYRTFGQKK